MKYILFVSFFIFLSSFHNISCVHQQTGSQIHKNQRVHLEDYPSAAAVILTDRSDITFSYSPQTGKPYAQVFHQKHIQILTTEGLQYSHIEIPYDQRSRIIGLKGTLLKSSGVLEEIEEEITLDLPYFSPSHPAADIYPEARLKKSKILGTQVGDIISYQYTEVFKDPRWISPLKIQAHLPTKRREIHVKFPNAFEVEVRLQQGDLPILKNPIQKETLVYGPNGQGKGVIGTQLSYVFTDQKAIRNEEYQGQSQFIAPLFHAQLKQYRLKNEIINAFADWDDVGVWYRKHISPKVEVSSAIQKIADQLGGRHLNKKLKVQRVQQYMQQRIRSFSWHRHISSLRSHSPHITAENRIGDPKDQAILAQSLLAAMGVESLPVLLSSGGSLNSVTDIPSPAIFDRIILALPSGGHYIFIDPVTPFLPVGMLKGSYYGQRALLIHQNEADLISLKKPAAEKSQANLHYRLKLTPQGKLSGVVQIKLSGLYAQQAREIILQKPPLTKNQQISELRQMLLSNDDSALGWQKIRLINAHNKFKTTEDFELELMIESSHLKMRNKDLQLQLQQILGHPLPFLWRETRFTDLLLPHTGIQTIDVALKLPNGLGLQKLPKSFEESSSYLNFSDNWSLDSGILYYQSKLKISENHIKSRDYKNFRDKMLSLWHNSKQLLLLSEGAQRHIRNDDDLF